MELSINKCRGCLSEQDEMLSLYEVYEHGLTLAMILQSCVATEVTEDDGLPSHLCDNCILVITQFYNFRIEYEQSDKELRKLLRQNKKYPPANQLVHEIHTGTGIVNKQADKVELGIGETNSHYNNELNKIVAVEVSREDVISNCTDDLNSYVHKNIHYGREQPEQLNDFRVYNTEQTETLQEFKKEVIIQEDLDVSNDVEYSDVQIPEDADVFVKKETCTIKREIPEYEEVIKYECTLCGESHLYATSFQQHMRNKHHMVDIDCDDYSRRIRIKVHQKIDVGDTNLMLSNKDSIYLLNEDCEKCKYCHKEFFLSQLQNHVKIHEANRKYVCDVCGSRFIRKTYLDDHMEGHSTEKKHVCKFCGKAFRRRTVLRAHKRVHTHPNHYVCEQCGRGFTNSSTLKTHRLLIHVRERNFECVICNLRFPLKSTLNKHVLRHQKRENGEKGFNCSQCEMQYRDKSSLKRHIETKHQGRIQLVACGDCPKQYTSKANLMKHRRKHHSGVTVLEFF